MYNDRYYRAYSTPECRTLWICGFSLGLWPIGHNLREASV